MTNSLHFREWRNCIRAQRKVNLCALGAPKGPKVGRFVRQYEIVCANDAGRAPRKYPVSQVIFPKNYNVGSFLSHIRLITTQSPNPKTNCAGWLRRVPVQS